MNAMFYLLSGLSDPAVVHRRPEPGRRAAGARGAERQAVGGGGSDGV